jgi:hypothetical protein
LFTRLAKNTGCDVLVYKARVSEKFMGNPSADPVPAITEADATGDVAALYADIRATLGVQVVNLIWRHLATFPNGLPWAWETLKPLYASGAIGAEAAALRSGLEIPALVGLTTPALAAANLSENDLKGINTILQSYERSNAMNMIAIGALSAQLEGQTGSKQSAPTPPVKEAPIDGSLPVLLTLDAMTPAVRALVEDLNRLGNRDAILASMYRHLAHWPAYLALLHVLIAPLNASGRLEPLIKSVIADAQNRAAQIASGLEHSSSLLPTDVKKDVHIALGQFFHGPLGKMIAIVPVIRAAMPT